MKCNSTQKQLLNAQCNEISEYHTYAWLAERIQNTKNREILERISKEEHQHYELLKRLTQRDIKPRKFRVLWYKLISRIFGLSFGLRLMEQGEEIGQNVYYKLKEENPEFADLYLDEQRHESEVLGLIEEERIAYAGSIVLGLNDALMELTGALAGLTFALQNNRLIAMTGFITDIAASMSMAASGFLSAREETDDSKNPLKSAAYTGSAYILTVLILILPYLLLHNVYVAVVIMMGVSVLIIFGYNFYITTAKGLRFWRRFSEMAAISVGVACISILIGVGVRTFFEIEI
jgi:VIT1/CCC1 family predicted Fe2+/Mn2+ transporter